MNTVTGLLEDAEEKQITKPAVKNWLDDLKDVAYDADDLLDEIAYKARERQHLEAAPKTCSDQVRNLFSSLNPCKKGIGELQPKLEKILCRIEDLLQQKEFLNLEKSDGAKPSLPSFLSSQGRLTTSLVDESGIYGRDGDKEAIIKLLLTDDERLGVVPIVGMGGVGKTTLSQLVYKDSRVKERFAKLKTWICVSCEDNEEGLFNVKRILRIFEVLSGLKINFYKSSLVGVNIDSQRVSDFANRLRCKAQSLPIKYLGMSLGVNPRSRRVWEDVINRVSSKLTAWKGKHLSIGAD